MKAVPASRYLLFFTLSLGGLAADLASKHWVFGWLGMPRYNGDAWWLVKGAIGLQTSLNEGALFGLGQGWVPLFATLSVLAGLFILWLLFITGAARDGWLTGALGCVAAGIFGNLYDRLGLPGLRWNYSGPLHRAGDPVYAVRDWILVRFGTDLHHWNWPNFNIADSLLVCGAILLVWHAFRNK
ncbi:MAG: signal peptidase II [Thermoguttaceae bacterium]|jgi:signal peptidase II